MFERSLKDCPQSVEPYAKLVGWVERSSTSYAVRLPPPCGGGGGEDPNPPPPLPHKGGGSEEGRWAAFDPPMLAYFTFPRCNSCFASVKLRTASPASEAIVAVCCAGKSQAPT